jgi:3-oxoadipate enol-lactonase
VISTHQVNVNGAKLAVTIEGASHLPWLIVSNPLATDHSLWNPQMAVLAKMRRVVRYDTRGHGKSSASAGPYDFNMLCGDVIAIMDDLNISIADVLGLSLGGMTVLGLCLDHAVRINRAICCCARADFPAQMISAWDDRITAVRADGMQAVAEGTLGRWFTETAKHKQPDIISHAREMILGTSVNGYCGCAEALKTLDYRRRLPNLAKPILYVAGQSDVAASPEAMRDMADATPHARFELIADAAHIANMENPGAFNTAICDFLIAKP